ncbi:hypothetical protein [Streptomyces sp. NPDC060031]|uniref:hypothetical protein n=1 Tax=Streptomyces sp. NPDC060031 TaxID=3347043 RepID=UPI0036AD854F
MVKEPKPDGDEGSSDGDDLKITDKYLLDFAERSSARGGPGSPGGAGSNGSGGGGGTGGGSGTSGGAGNGASGDGRPPAADPAPPAATKTYQAVAGAGCQGSGAGCQGSGTEYSQSGWYDDGQAGWKTYGSGGWSGDGCNPAYYTVQNSLSPGSGTIDSFIINQPSKHGSWASGGTYDVRNGQLAVKLHDRGQDWVGNTKTYAHNAASAVRVSCTA